MFFPRCGSHLAAEIGGDILAVTLGTVDDAVQVRPGVHMFVKPKAPWFEITDGQPQYPEYPPHMQPPE